MLMAQKLCQSLIFPFLFLKENTLLVQLLLSKLGQACVLMAGISQNEKW